MDKSWVTMKASKDNVGISHLLFADGLMLFAKANIEGAKSIKNLSAWGNHMFISLPMS